MKNSMKWAVTVFVVGYWVVVSGYLESDVTVQGGGILPAGRGWQGWIGMYCQKVADSANPDSTAAVASLVGPLNVKVINGSGEERIVLLPTDVSCGGQTPGYRVVFALSEDVVWPPSEFDGISVRTSLREFGDGELVVVDGESVRMFQVVKLRSGGFGVRVIWYGE